VLRRPVEVATLRDFPIISLYNPFWVRLQHGAVERSSYDI